MWRVKQPLHKAECCSLRAAGGYGPACRPRSRGEAHPALGAAARGQCHPRRRHIAQLQRRRLLLELVGIVAAVVGLHAQHVARLDVAVDQPRVVELLDALRGAAEDRARLARADPRDALAAEGEPERALRLGAAAGSANEWAPPAAHPTIAALSALANGLDDEEEAPWDGAASDDAASDAPQSEAGGHHLQARFSVLAADDGGSRGRGRSCCSDVGIGAASPGRGAARLQAVREFHGEDEEDDHDGARSAVSAATVLQRAPFQVLFSPV